MAITITLYCPDCRSTAIKKNGKKISGKQNYLCKSCFRQFIGDHALSYKGWHSELTHKILFMPVRGVGIMDVSEIKRIIINKVLPVLVNSNYVIAPQRSRYDRLEIDEFWTYVGNKQNKVGLFMLTTGIRVKLWPMCGGSVI